MNRPSTNDTAINVILNRWTLNQWWESGFCSNRNMPRLKLKICLEMKKNTAKVQTFLLKYINMIWFGYYSLLCYCSNMGEFGKQNSTDICILAIKQQGMQQFSFSARL